MTFTRFLFEYTLHVVCNGNKSVFGRRLGIPKTEINRLHKRLVNGGGSMVTTDALLKMFLEDDVSLDKAAEAYQTYLQNPEQYNQENPCIHKQLIEAFLSDSVKRREARKDHEVYHRFNVKSTDYLNHLSRIVCDNYDTPQGCLFHGNDGDGSQCPCKLFIDFVLAARASMEENNGIPSDR